MLDAIVTYFERDGGQSHPQVYDIAALAGLDDDSVAQACLNLDGAYIDFERGMGPRSGWSIKQVFSQARIATGQWPTAESLAARIIAGLEETAAQEPDEAKRGKIREAVTVLGETAKDVTTNVLTAVILRSTGMG